MKTITILTTASALVISSLLASAETEVPYGVEALTSYRSEYTYRGFQLADETLDFQLSSQVALDDSTSINLAAWYGTGLSNSDFSELGLFADIRKNSGQFTYALSGTYRDYSQTFFESGVDIAASVTWHVSDSWDLGIVAAYDTGAEGWYTELNSSYYYRISDNSYVTLKGGVSGVSDYYSRDGLNDLFAKFSYTYNINKSVSISPYIASSVLLDSDDAGQDSFFGGVYFAVSF